MCFFHIKSITMDALNSFLQITKWNGPVVIYFCDHLFSDLRGPLKAGWRNAAIIHELESEIHIPNEEGYRFEKAKFHTIQELLGKLHATVANSQRTEACELLLAELNLERVKRMLNKSFGATFLTDTGQESAFAYHIHQYADVYTSKAENFLHHPPEAWLHVPFDVQIMPHHVKVLSSLFKKSIVIAFPTIIAGNGVIGSPLRLLGNTIAKRDITFLQILIL